MREILPVAATSGPPTSRVRAVHEWPLVAFTTLAIIGAGLLASPLLALVAVGTPGMAADLVSWGALLLGAGLAVSFGHLGRPLRAPRALCGLWRSRLSAEITLAGTTLALGTAAIALGGAWVSVLAACSAAAFLGSLGLVYNLPGQITWGGAAAWTPLSTGVGVGALALAGAAPGDVAHASPLIVACAVMLAIDAALAVLRWRALAWRADSILATHPALFARRRALLAARVLLANVGPALLLVGRRPLLASAVLACGILMDRILFYGCAAQQTTESEVDRAEDLISRIPSER